MGDVIDFRKARNKAPADWWTGAALCLDCFTPWVAIFPTDANIFKLECPVCGKMRSFVTFLPDEFLEG